MTRHSKTFAATAAVAALTLSLGACASVTEAFHRKAAPVVDASLNGPVPTDLKGYLSPDSLDGKALLGPPPAEGSLRWQSDRQTYEETRKLEGSARWTTAIQDNDIWSAKALDRFSCAAGVELGPKTTPALWKLLHRIELDVRTIGTPAKNFYNRSRPMIGDDKPICIPREPWMKANASYPSGHAMVGWSWGLILTQLKPERADGLLAAGKAIGDSRVICGVHYASDVEAGRTLAAAMVAREMADPEFQRDLAGARSDIAKAPVRTEGCPSVAG